MKILFLQLFILLSVTTNSYSDEIVIQMIPVINRSIIGSATISDVSRVFSDNRLLAKEISDLKISEQLLKETIGKNELINGNDFKKVILEASRKYHEHLIKIVHPPIIRIEHNIYSDSEIDNPTIEVAKNFLIKYLHQVGLETILVKPIKNRKYFKFKLDSSLQLSISNKFPQGRMGVWVEGSLITNKRSRMQIWFDVSAEEKVMRLSRNVAEGELLTEDDFEITYLNVRQKKSSIFSLNNSLKLYQYKFDINKGEVLYKEMLKEAYDIRKSENVKVISTTGPVTIESEALARESGYVGEIITLESNSSNKLFRAQIVSRGITSIDSSKKF